MLRLNSDLEIILLAIAPKCDALGACGCAREVKDTALGVSS